MVNYKKGLDDVSNEYEGSGFSWFKVKENETKTIRFLTEAPDIIRLPLHFIKIGKFKGSVMCQNDPDTNKFDCPMCKVAQKEFTAPVGMVAERMFAVIIDRESKEAKLFQGTASVMNKVAESYRLNKSLTNVDYSISLRRGKNNFLEYSLNALVNTAGELKPEEKALVTKINMDDVIKGFTKTDEEVTKILRGEYAPKKKSGSVLDDIMGSNNVL